MRQVPAEGRHRRGRGAYCRDEIGTTGPDQHGSPGRQAADIGPQRKLRSPGCGRQGRSVAGSHSERNANTVRSRRPCDDVRRRRGRLVALVERFAQQQTNQVGERDTPRSCPLDQLALEAAEIDDEHVSGSMRLGGSIHREASITSALKAPIPPSLLNVGLLAWVTQCVGRVVVGFMA